MELISDKRQLKVLGETSKAWSKRYSWDTQSKKFMELIDHTLPGNKEATYGGSYLGNPLNKVSKLLSFGWIRRES